MAESTFSPAGKGTPAIEVRGLSIGYGSRVVLENLNFRIEPGQIVTILGGSGCGKSTLLKHIIGLYKPLRGDILVNGRSIVNAGEVEKRSIRWESLEIPYRGNRFRMQIVLPRPGVTVSDLATGWLSETEALPKNTAELEGLPWTAYLELSLPKFSFGADPDVGDAVRRLGATDAFDPARADFSGMFPPSAEPLYLTRFSHRAVIEVDERGTTAAAGSGMSFGCSAPAHPGRLVVDRPFVFFIRDPDGRVR